MRNGIVEKNNYTALAKMFLNVDKARAIQYSTMLAVNPFSFHLSAVHCAIVLFVPAI